MGDYGQHIGKGARLVGRAPRGQVAVTDRMRKAHALAREGTSRAILAERFGVSRKQIDRWVSKVEERLADDRALGGGAAR